MADIATKVIDASALVTLLFAEEQGSTVADQIRGHVLVAPALLDFEIVNVCLSKIRRQPDRREALLDAFAGRRQLRIETMEVDHVAVLALARNTGLTGYDASYLHLARTLEVELITLDRQLAGAAEKFQ
jgi:predicted nucleic acid-binding protein